MLINFFGTSLLFITSAYSSLCLTTIHWAANKYNSTQEAANKSPFNTCSHHLLHMPGLPRGYWFTPKPSFLKHTAEQYLTLEVKKVGFLKTWGGRVENRQNRSADTTGFLYFFLYLNVLNILNSELFSQIVSLEAFSIHLLYIHLLLC